MDGDDDAVAIVVRVVRTGGFAGLRREWTAEPGPGDASVWITLIEDCPWDAAPERPAGADRFVWAIEAHLRAAERTARLGDGDIHGPWRTLVDAVRDFADPAEQKRPPADRRR